MFSKYCHIKIITDTDTLFNYLNVFAVSLYSYVLSQFFLYVYMNYTRMRKRKT